MNYDVELTENEEVIIKILEKSGSYSRGQMITPKELIANAANEGIADSMDVERALVTLIDKDVVEYEMDDDLNVSELWLLKE